MSSYALGSGVDIYVFAEGIDYDHESLRVEHLMEDAKDLIQALDNLKIVPV